MITGLEKDIVRILQEGLPLVSRPFLAMAERLGITEDTLIDAIRDMQSRGLIRRFGAAVKHQALGYTANAMVVWKVEGEDAIRAGEIFSAFAEVSHCYLRENSGGWQHSLFTMVHGKTGEECHQIARTMSKASGLTEYLVLFSTEELKKNSMKYFTEE
ncbi:MAG: transcriptional regulator [Peptococcaceae bacterium BRH_c4a]|nr:MAG: transcriptional regulator [Peptococcaceae bacterium BRH_c4a]